MHVIALVCLISLAVKDAVGINLSDCEVLDLTHELESDIPYYYAGQKGSFNMTITSRSPFFDAEYLEYNFICSYDHFGTHMDAPVHFKKGGVTVDKVPFTQLIGEAYVIDITKKVEKDPGYLLTVNDVTEWEEKYGVIPSNAILILNTGQTKHWKNYKKYMGTNDRTNSKEYLWAAFSGELGDWLVANRNIRAYGLDSMSFDAAQSKDFPFHIKLLGKDIPGIENLKLDDRLPPRGATIFIPPFKTAKGSGGWVRAFAVGWNGPNDPCRIGYGKDGSSMLHTDHYMIIVLIVSCVMYFELF